jgi:hypothetical protein
MLDNKQLSIGEDIRTELFYPSHPFPAYLCQKIARFPLGFRELALSGQLSVQFIDFLYLTVLSAQLNSEDVGSLSTVADDVLGMSSLTTLEFVLGIALTAYNMYFERKLRTVTGGNPFYLQRRVKVLAARSDILACDPDALEWACLSLRATTEKDANLWRWADAWLRATQTSDYRRQRVLGRAFLPIP